MDLAQYFDAVIGDDYPYGRKPDPRGLLALTNASQRVLMVGDSPIDWATATAAGCGFVWARYGFGAARFHEQAPATPYVLDRPRDLLEVVERCRALDGA